MAVNTIVRPAFGDIRNIKPIQLIQFSNHVAEILAQDKPDKKADFLRLMEFGTVEQLEDFAQKEFHLLPRRVKDPKGDIETFMLTKKDIHGLKDASESGHTFYPQAYMSVLTDDYREFGGSRNSKTIYLIANNVQSVPSITLLSHRQISEMDKEIRVRDLEGALKNNDHKCTVRYKL